MRNVDYADTFILIADDSPVDRGTAPPVKPENPSIAARQFAMIHEHPYEHTSADVIFGVYADRSGIPEPDRPEAMDMHFSVGRPCLRASDLGKKYGWGIHCDAQGKIAAYGADSTEYAALVEQNRLSGVPALVKAMRTSRKRP